MTTAFSPCPACSNPLRADGSCPACYYGNRPAAKGGNPSDWWKCANVDRGQRCGRPGVVSPSTLGGPMYCWQHVPGFQQFRDDKPKDRAEAAQIGQLAAKVGQTYGPK